MFTKLYYTPILLHPRIATCNLGPGLQYLMQMVTVELRPHGIAPMNATSLFMVFWSSMLFPDSGGDAPVPSSMLFPDSGFEIAEEPLGRNSNGTEKNINCPGPKSIFQRGGENILDQIKKDLDFFANYKSPPLRKML